MSGSELEVPNPDVMAKFADWLQEEGYRAKITEDGSAIHSAASGLNFSIFPDDSSAQFHMALILADDMRPTLEECNNHNKEWRFMRIYLDKDLDLVSEMDVIVTTENDCGKEIFSKGLAIWNNALGRLQYWLAERSQDDSPQEEQGDPATGLPHPLT